ncbi:hypothetical protein F11_02705 [Rhodospirillum rubrum F11]|uniref:Flagellar FliJ protein n=1 Tax=Rhodospirillum rubrum (strain ATCC 11170 / ATH 1.1.1 / DSM 467 / LMG 4362 / NCIMB 8255 / S1) TaxID=269796 RepID=Q2RX14_RHORT|nr:flagellar export protein FliJ [Rhodospirillum rubrum]ABC21331.1 conserved hypothetical protein [Rhodospirillum rubrum ATCC 11170]AEO47011.1 hypothetical protein F11_02705 [Rhodospirillum rubrum F11]MBK5952918.1 flagellar export protein FliJ [Rhodospirillum rubrum]QXG81012.1 flagellar export protein FliJ [Rhodospirillum rubrum]HAQ00693.1 flagellar export protein FliJ [Rhodospirillum rubrum]
MAKSLQTLIRLRKFEVDECRRALGELFAAEAELEARVAALEAERSREEAFARDPGVMIPGIGFTLGNFVAHYLARKAALAEQKRLLDLAIEEAREALAEAFRVVKTLEITRDQRDAREREERDRRDQAALDEIGLTLYRRRKAEDRRSEE